MDGRAVPCSEAVPSLMRIDDPMRRAMEPDRILARSVMETLGGRICWRCGCSDLDACLDLDGWPCQWVAVDLCSACSPLAPHPSALIDVKALAAFL